MNERDMLVAIFYGICGLAEKLTGERMIVTVTSENGQRFSIHGQGVTWETPVEQPMLSPTVNIDGRKVAEAVNRHINKPA